jgi:hypothetical protein
MACQTPRLRTNLYHAIVQAPIYDDSSKHYRNDDQIITDGKTPTLRDYPIGCGEIGGYAFVSTVRAGLSAAIPRTKLCQAMDRMNCT